MPDSVSSQVSKNPRLFILFRIFFNCRFYYPVYAIMFLDFGLSQEQFATLNVAWAIAIVILEVPSGALADQFGRRTLIIWAAILMVVEMVILGVTPVVDRSAFEGDPDGLNHAVFVLFAIFIVNRVISGAAEASASGADEALAYDSLEPDDRTRRWAQFTSKLMKWQSVAFIVVTLTGAAVYDPAVVNTVAGWLGVDHEFTQAQTLKFPIYLTFGMSVISLIIAFKMKEPEELRPKCDLPAFQSIREGFRRTFAAGGWIMRTPAALMLILVGLFFDSVVRLYYTVGSIWLEVIGYAPRYFGVIAVFGSLTGILAATIGARLIDRHSPNFNFRMLALLIFGGLLSLALPIRYWSVVFLPTLWMAMRLIHFFLSNYLNRVTDSENRATVLSFRGLTMNLSYGLVVYLYGVQTAFLRDRIEPENPETLTEDAQKTLNHEIFAEAVSWWWIYFLVVITALWIFRRIRCRKSWNQLLPDP